MPVFNQSRSRVIRLIFLVAFIVIIAQLINLQIVSSQYGIDAIKQAVFPKIVWPERGIIYDRKGKPVLNNTRMFDLVVIPAEVKNLDTLSFCSVMEIDTAEFNRKMTMVVAKNKSRVLPGTFEDLLTPQMQARFEENSWRYPGFALVERPVRSYPYNVAAQILGYINEVDPSDIEKSGNFYRQGDYIGKSGLESAYEKVLMGQRGVQYLIKDNHGRLVGSYRDGILDTAAIAGRGLRTYVDIELQQLAEKLMSNKVGAVVAIEPKTGGILAMASGPTFNPNELTGPEKNKNYSRLVLDVAGPLLNRAIMGRYPPGSTYKPLGALVGLDEGVISPSSGIACSGAYYGCNRPVKCTESFAGHAANLRTAIAWSCNSFFSNTFRLTVDNPAYRNPRKGLTKWKEYLSAFDLGHRTGIDLPSENGGNVPDTAAYDKEYRGQWNSCTMVTIGIGQDKLLVTPLQMANAICIVANKGYYYTPHFVEKIDNETAEDTILNKYRQKHEVLTHISDTAYNAVIGGMQDVVTNGTARIVQIPGINICAKTGTAENYRVIDGRRTQLKDNSMFVCFAPRENPKIAIAVVVENAGFGATWAGPIARILMEKYLNDTLQTKSQEDLERISNSNLMPPYLKRLQFIEDSTRARRWFETTKDSAYLKKYVRYIAMEKNTVERNPQRKEKTPAPVTESLALLPDEKYFRKTSIQPVP